MIQSIHSFGTCLAVYRELNFLPGVVFETVSIWVLGPIGLNIILHLPQKFEVVEIVLFP
jgi:hypothetical protein